MISTPIKDSRQSVAAEMSGSAREVNLLISGPSEITESLSLSSRKIFLIACHGTSEPCPQHFAGTPVASRWVRKTPDPTTRPFLPHSVKDILVTFFLLKSKKKKK